MYVKKTEKKKEKKRGTEREKRKVIKNRNYLFTSEYIIKVILFIFRGNLYEAG